MRNSLLYCLFSLMFLVITCSLFAQDSLKLLNGRVVSIRIQSVSALNLTYSESFKGKTRNYTKELSSIFSYQKENKNEVIVYEYDPEIGNIYTVEEMKDFILGEQHADKYYKPTLLNCLSVVGGATAGYFLAQGEPLMIAFPLVFSTAILLPETNVKTSSYNQKYIENESYYSGYKRIAKSRKFFQSLKFSAISTLGSFLVFKAIDN